MVGVWRSAEAVDPAPSALLGRGLQPGRAGARVPALPGLVLPLLLGVGPRHFLMPSSSPADQTLSLVDVFPWAAATAPLMMASGRAQDLFPVPQQLGFEYEKSCGL